MSNGTSTLQPGFALAEHVTRPRSKIGPLCREIWDISRSVPFNEQFSPLATLESSPKIHISNVQTDRTITNLPITRSWLARLLALFTARLLTQYRRHRYTLASSLPNVFSTTTSTAQLMRHSIIHSYIDTVLY